MGMLDIVTGADLSMGMDDGLVSSGAAYGEDIIGDDFEMNDGISDPDLMGDSLVIGAGGGAAAVRAKVLKAGTAMVTRRPHKARRFPLGITPTNIGAGASLSINVQPQTYFRAERLFVPATIGPFFSIRDIKVGNVSQFPANVEVPAEIFSQTGVDTDIRLDTNDPSIFLSVDTLNISLAPAVFRGAFIGTAVQ